MRKTLILLAVIISPILLQAGNFPLCMYGVNDIKYIKTVKDAGFNCVQTYKQEPEYLKQFAQEAQRLNMEIVIYPQPLYKSAFLQEAKTWPVKAWYFYDEPDIYNIAPSKVKEIEATAKANFPGMPTAFVVSKGVNIKPYYDIADIVMVDWYPVPHLPLTSFGEQVKEIKQILIEKGLPNKPLWGVMQSFDWRNYNQNGPVEERVGRFPTVSEMRFMAYHGLMEGADGLFFYAFVAQKKPLLEVEPENWKRVVTVSKEISKIMPIFEYGTPIKTPVEVNDSLLLKTFLYKGKYYDFLLNLSDSEQSIPMGLLKKSFKTLFTKQPKNIAPYDVLIFKRSK